MTRYSYLIRFRCNSSKSPHLISSIYLLHVIDPSPLAYNPTEVELFAVPTKTVHTDSQSSLHLFFGIITIEYRHTHSIHG